MEDVFPSRTSSSLQGCVMHRILNVLVIFSIKNHAKDHTKFGMLKFILRYCFPSCSGVAPVRSLYWQLRYCATVRPASPLSSARGRVPPS